MDTNREELTMRKQYDIIEARWPYYDIDLYHDGIKVDSKHTAYVGEATEALEREGYTLGYTDDEIEKARKKYEHKLENRIGPDVETYDGEWLVGGKCTACNNYSHVRTKYCPNCGAKMKGAK